MGSGAFRFVDYGGVYQLGIEDAGDLVHLHEIDRARWASTSVPTASLYADPDALARLDKDGNKRVRVDELIAARDWLFARLADRSRMDQAVSDVELAALDPAATTTRPLKALAERLIREAGAAAKDRVTLAQVRDFKARYASTFPNGDGVLPRDHVDDEALLPLFDAVLATTGGAPDLSGAQGVTAAHVEQFAKDGERFIAWGKRAADDPSSLRPLGDATEHARALVADLDAKVSQFFSQCALVALEANASTRLQASEDELKALDVKDPTKIEAFLAEAPLARPNADARLALDGAKNPRFADALVELARDVGPALLDVKGPLTSVTQADWAAMKARLAPVAAWHAERPTGFEGRAVDDIAALLAGDGLTKLRARIDADAAVKEELEVLLDLEAVLLLQRWLVPVARNMVSFPDLFEKPKRALFESGTLILDGRRLSLCMKVTDKATHKKVAEQSLMFITYVDLTRKTASGADETTQIVAAVTAGTRGGIDVGKRGVFYDRDDAEWDAVITDVIVQPISVWEAAIAPVERLRNTIADRVTKLVGNKADALEKDAHAATSTSTAPAPAAKADAGGMGGLGALVVGGGVAFAALGSALAFVVKTLAEIDLAKLVGIVGALVLATMAIFGFLGWLKLRRRDLSTLLEASGWALNGRMRLTSRLAGRFTVRPPVPRAAKKESAGGVPAWLVVVLLVVGVLAALGVAKRVVERRDAEAAAAAATKAPDAPAGEDAPAAEPAPAPTTTP